MYKCILVACIVAGVVSARSTVTTSKHSDNSISPDINEIDGSNPRSSDVTGFLGDFKFLYKIYQDCSSSDVPSCLKLKLLTAMDRVAKSFPTITLVDGVELVKDPNASVVEKEMDLEAVMARKHHDKYTLDELIWKKFMSFFQTHTMKIKLPTLTEIERSFNGGEEEARKKKKMNGLMLVPFIIAGTLIPLAFGALAILAGKALIISKLALVLASIIGIRRLLAGFGLGNLQDGQVEVIAQTHAGPHPWGRSINTADQAQNIAYRGQIRQSS